MFPVHKSSLEEVDVIGSTELLTELSAKISLELVTAELIALSMLESVILSTLESIILSTLDSTVLEVVSLLSVILSVFGVASILASVDTSLDEATDSLCVDSVESSSEQEQSNAKRRRVSIKSFFICQNQRITSNIALSSPSVSTPLRDLTS